MRPLRFALFGHPVSHSISPSIHRAAFAALGLPHTYEAWDLAGDAALEAAFQALRRGDIEGANVTAPHKQKSLELSDSIASSAKGVGAANVLRREPVEKNRSEALISAHNTDVDALAQEISIASPVRFTALVLGAGGAALAAVVALKRLGFSAVGVTTRSFVSPAASSRTARFRELGAVPIAYPDASSERDFRAWIARTDLLVQATSAGTKSAADPSSGEALAALIPWELLRPSAIAFDLVYNPRMTPFLRRAEARGLTTVGGLGMLVRQAALSIKLWTGITPPLNVLFAAAAEALA